MVRTKKPLRHRTTQECGPVRGPIRCISILTCCLLCSLLHPAASHAGEEVTIDGILHIRNGTTPSEGREVVRLEEIWRAGGPDDEETMFGLIGDVVGDPEGNVYVLDAQLREVPVYSPGGAHLRTLFGPGEGPGEVQGPRDLIPLPDGTLGAGEDFAQKIVVVDRQGVPQPTLRPRRSQNQDGPFADVVSGASGGSTIALSGNYVLPSEQPGVQERNYFLALFNRDGVEQARLLDAHGQYNFNDFRFSERDNIPCFWFAFDVGPDGRVFASSEWDRYTISVFRPDGSVDRIIERETAPRERTAQEADWVRRMIASALTGIRTQKTIEVEPFDPAVAVLFRSIHVGEDGTLWVMPCRGHRDQQEGILATYDLFDPAGHFVKQVAFACEGNGSRDALFFISPGQVVLVKGYLAAMAAMFGSGTPIDDEGEPQPMEIVCYRMP